MAIYSYCKDIISEFTLGGGVIEDYNNIVRFIEESSKDIENIIYSNDISINEALSKESIKQAISKIIETIKEKLKKFTVATKENINKLIEKLYHSNTDKLQMIMKSYKNIDYDQFVDNEYTFEHTLIPNYSNYIEAIKTNINDITSRINKCLSEYFSNHSSLSSIFDDDDDKKETENKYINHKAEALNSLKQVQGYIYDVIGKAFIIPEDKNTLYLGKNPKATIDVIYKVAVDEDSVKKQFEDFIKISIDRITSETNKLIRDLENLDVKDGNSTSVKAINAQIEVYNKALLVYNDLLREVNTTMSSIISFSRRFLLKILRSSSIRDHIKGERIKQVEVRNSNE